MVDKKALIILVILILPRLSLAVDGVWQGVFDINGHGRYDFTGLINKKNVTAFTEKAKVVYKGNISISEEHFKWNLSMYLKDGTMFGSAEIKGKLIDSNTMSGTWITEPAKDFGNIYLIKKSSSVQDTGDDINKKWVSSDSKIKKNFYIKNNKIKGNDENGCNYYGLAEKLNSKIYSINLEIASCGISDGVYIGMAYIEVEESKEKLKINATNKNFSLLMKFK